VHHLQEHIKPAVGAETALLFALAQRCSEDDWPSNAIRCVRDATSPSEFETCEQLLSPAQRTRLEAGFVVRRGTSKAEIAKIAVMKYVGEAFPSWAAAHPDKACPASLDELNEYLAEVATKDPWGQPYRMFCGAGLPPGVKGLAVTSAGEDGNDGTPDDIKSW